MFVLYWNDKWGGQTFPVWQDGFPHFIGWKTTECAWIVPGTVEP